MADEIMPGPAPRNTTTVEQRIAALERKVEELTRKKSYPFSVAPDDNVMFRIAPDPNGAVTETGAPRANVEIGFGDGRFALTSRPGPDNPAVQRLSIWDHEQNELIYSDDYTGYGFARPRMMGTFCLLYTMYDARWDLYKPSANNTLRTMYWGYLPAMNPGVRVSGRVQARSASATPCTAQVRFVYYDSAVNELGSSPWFSCTAAANTENEASIFHNFLVPEAAMFNMVLVAVHVQMSSGANGTNVCSFAPYLLSGAETYEGWEND